MNPNKYSQEISLPAPDKSIWISLAWDGHYYYLLLQNSNLIYQYNCNFECIKHFDACKQYSSICYDHKSKCFWAASKACPNTIYKLNNCLLEIDKLFLPTRNGIGGIVTGLSYNCACHKLLVAFTSGIVSLDTVNETFRPLNKLQGGAVTGVLSIYPGYVVSQETMSGQCVKLFDNDNCELDQKPVPNHFRVEQILYDPCHENPVFYSLVTKKKCYSSIIPQCISSEALNIQIDCCYCKECKHSCPCKKHQTLECHDEVSVMQSIALMEAALAHILNAEGEKLQKVLATTDDMHTIMCVNQQVTHTIIHVTQLEQLLYEKLFVLQKICCEQPHPKYDDCKCEQ